MTYSEINEQTISIERVFLDLKNPRHEPYKNQDDVIQYLCAKENVLALAKDIAKYKLNPLERFGLIPLDNKEKPSRNSKYKMAEGNRRLCAMMLLNDPDLAPASMRNEFKKLSEKVEKISEIRAVIFENQKAADFWIGRIHNGVQGGVGRQPWDADQKTRHFGDNKNILALRLLDYAQKKGFITAQQREKQITTVQRYLDKSSFKDVIGIAAADSKKIYQGISEKDFDLLVKKFIKDLLSRKVNSRANSKEIKVYAEDLARTKGLSEKRTEDSDDKKNPDNGKSGKPPKRPQNPANPTRIKYDQDVEKSLKATGNYKLLKIYYSLHTVKLDMHTPLLSVGAWAFFECLAAAAGNTAGDFSAFLSNNRLQNDIGIKKEETKYLREAFERIARYGNTTKHHSTAANFNGTQLASDMQHLKPVICGLAEMASKKTS